MGDKEEQFSKELDSLQSEYIEGLIDKNSLEDLARVPQFVEDFKNKCEALKQKYYQLWPPAKECTDSQCMDFLQFLRFVGPLVEDAQAKLKASIINQICDQYAANQLKKFGASCIR